GEEIGGGVVRLQQTQVRTAQGRRNLHGHDDIGRNFEVVLQRDPDVGAACCGVEAGDASDDLLAVADVGAEDESVRGGKLDGHLEVAAPDGSADRQVLDAVSACGDRSDAH